MEAEDSLLRRILAVTLRSETADPLASPPIIFLRDLAEEMIAEAPGEQPRLRRDILDIVLVHRLIEHPPPANPQAPLAYLLGCYTRASHELRALSKSPENEARTALLAAAQEARQLAVSYAALVTAGSGMVPEPAEAEARGALQLLDAMDARDAEAAASGGLMGPAASSSRPVGVPPGTVALPPGFLEDLAAHTGAEELGALVAPIARELARRVAACSPLGDYARPLAQLRQLVGVEQVARALVAPPLLLPDLARLNGRAVQMPSNSWLGPCFSVSAVFDPLVPAQPGVYETCFSNISTRRQGDVAAAMASLRLAGKHVVGELHALVRALLGKATREAALDWLSAVIVHNAERGKMQPNMEVAAGDGFFLNLGAVLLKLCAPFHGAGSATFWTRVDEGYLQHGRMAAAFKEDTRLAASAEEVAAHLAESERSDAGGAASTSGGGGAVRQYHFVCEAFFMTLRALHLGLVQLVERQADEARTAAAYSEDIEHLAALTERMSGHQAAVARAQLEAARGKLDRLKARRVAVETAVGEPEALGDALAHYRLLAAWLMRVAAPQSAGLPSLPLPDQVPPSFAVLPEWLVEDLADFLLYTSRYHPQVLSSAGLSDLALFLVVFIGSPRYVRSPYLRSKLSEVLHAWLPPPADPSTGWQRGSRRGGDELSFLFEAHPLVVQHLVPSLLALYADVERTERQNQFYIRFNMRQSIGDILLYAWQLPGHRAAWRAYAAAQGGRGPYLRFADNLINDSIYLLDESLRHLKTLREAETVMADPAAWAALGQARQQEVTESRDASERHLPSLLFFASGTIKLLATTCEEVTAPFLLPEMVDRIAAMLNYFLLYLTGPERKNLKVANPEKYTFNPKELLAAIGAVYARLDRSDGEGALAAAIARDRRSYRDDMFDEAALVLRQFALLPEGEIMALEALATKVATAAAVGAAEDEIMGEVPDEFLDPITYSLMRDPVRLPTSGSVFDRPSIARHLLSDQRDPINRQPLTSDMLQPDTELKARIEAWLAEQRARKAS